MGSALVKGAVREGSITADSVRVFDVIDTVSKRLADEIGASIASSNDDLIVFCAVIFNTFPIINQYLILENVVILMIRIIIYIILMELNLIF